MIYYHIRCVKYYGLKCIIFQFGSLFETNQSLPSISQLTNSPILFFLHNVFANDVDLETNVNQ